MDNIWNFVIAAYAITGAGLIALTLGVWLNARRWAKRARAADPK